jgi:hypothetical protein
LGKHVWNVDALMGKRLRIMTIIPQRIAFLAHGISRQVNPAGRITRWDRGSCAAHASQTSPVFPPWRRLTFDGTGFALRPKGVQEVHREREPS